MARPVSGIAMPDIFPTVFSVRDHLAAQGIDNADGPSEGNCFLHFGLSFLRQKALPEHRFIVNTEVFPNFLSYDFTTAVHICQYLCCNMPVVLQKTRKGNRSGTIYQGELFSFWSFS